MLWDHEICNEKNKEDYEYGLSQGHHYSQISEYAAIYLAHKCRRFDVDVQLGLADEIRPSKFYSREGQGLVSKYNFKQSVQEEVSLEEHPVEIDDMTITTSSSLKGHEIKSYIGVVIAHSLMNENEFTHLNEGEESSVTYQGLIQELKDQAYKIKANGIIDINYQTTPVVSSLEKQVRPFTKLPARAMPSGL